MYMLYIGTVIYMYCVTVLYIYIYICMYVVGNQIMCFPAYYPCANGLMVIHALGHIMYGYVYIYIYR